VKLKSDLLDVLKASYKERPKFVSKTLIIFCSVLVLLNPSNLI
jgi:hypothetical protein